MTSLCDAAGMTRQNYYKGRVARQRQSVDEALILELVRRERALQPQLGARKLLGLLGPELKEAGVELGRDRFFALLARHKLLVPRVGRGVRTTWSGHGYGVYVNLLKGLSLTGPDQAWVSDITYIRTSQGFMYLSLVMDAFSRTIVGYDCSDSLEMEGALRALSMALDQLPAGARPVHHSDRGIQYCCGAYVSALSSRGLSISMTEENHCYENAKAERLNGTLKREYGLGAEFGRKSEVKVAVSQAVSLYNSRRPHAALGYRVPLSVHRPAA